jgi:hypothetical protein
MSEAIDADLAALEARARHYLDALYDGDAEALASVFLPSSALTQSLDGELRITPRDAWLEIVRNRPAPRAAGLARHDRILTIDRVSGDLALVKLACAIPPKHFVDLLCFVKIDGVWWIAQKVFTTEVRG